MEKPAASAAGFFVSVCDTLNLKWQSSLLMERQGALPLAPVKGRRPLETPCFIEQFEGPGPRPWLESLRGE
jgi:hypothetical protein